MGAKQEVRREERDRNRHESAAPCRDGGNVAQPTAECAVAFLDILGFTSLVGAQVELDHLSRRVLGCLNSELARQTAKECSVSPVIFGDSILARTAGLHGGTRELVDMLKYCATILSLSIYARLPVRGAVAWGRVLWDDERSIRIGTPINEAVQWERMQDWAGVMMTSSAMSYMNRHPATLDEAKDFLFPLTEELVPLKGEPRRRIRAGVVRPAVDSPGEYERLAEVLQNLGLESCNPEIQSKFDATAQLFLNHKPDKPSPEVDDSA